MNLEFIEFIMHYAPDTGSSGLGLPPVRADDPGVVSIAVFWNDARPVGFPINLFPQGHWTMCYPAYISGHRGMCRCLENETRPEIAVELYPASLHGHLDVLAHIASFRRQHAAIELTYKALPEGRIK